MLVELFKNAGRSMSNPPKIVHFGRSHMGTTIVFESPSNTTADARTQISKTEA